MPTAQRVYAMLENESLWETAVRCHELLAQAKIPHAVIGGVAVCLHGYQRNTIDLDLLVRKTDTRAIRKTLSDAGFVWDEKQAEFRSPSRIPVHFLFSGDQAGQGSDVAFPNPAIERHVSTMDIVPVLTVLPLIEIKLARGLCEPRWMYKEFADVVELIDLYGFDEKFERSLHKSLRPAFRDLVTRARGGE